MEQNVVLLNVNESTKEKEKANTGEYPTMATPPPGHEKETPGRTVVMIRVLLQFKKRKQIHRAKGVHCIPSRSGMRNSQCELRIPSSNAQ